MNVIEVAVVKLMQKEIISMEQGKKLIKNPERVHALIEESERMREKNRQRIEIMQASRN
ncbi:MAG: hypothetical protein HY917_02365 [Candidatus Diapherotrites archaeon]|nr:hypothetical protein [Candidatus Diapherotrites archaeon]